MALSEFYLNMFLYCLRLFGYKLIWTVHDLLPHEKTFINDTVISQRLADASDVLIVLNIDTKITLVKYFGIQVGKVMLIPHGNFIDYYPGCKKAMSHRFGTHFLFFGQIKPYKGIDSLIKNFKLLTDNSIGLSIVGQCNENNYLNKIRLIIGKDERISVINNFIPDSLVSEVFANSDRVVLPFEEITNTGSAILAFSMRKLIIAPRIGMIKDFPDNTGFYYDPKVKWGLKLALKEALNNKKLLPTMCKNSYDYAKLYDWKKISLHTEEVYHSVLNRQD